MPTYEYRCRKGHTFELFQKMSDEPADTCTVCGDVAERVVSGGAGFLFRGEGFYITDYRSEEYRKKAEAEKGAGEKTGAGSDAGSTKESAASTDSSSGKSEAGSPGGGSSSTDTGASTKPGADE